MNDRPAPDWAPAHGRLWKAMSGEARHYAAAWAGSAGLIGLHLVKTAAAALMALGIAMLIELPSPRTAMVTVFVLMQPMTGMVLAKSFYRVLGTAAGVVASVTFGALFPQQPELYLAAITLWCATCTALAVRFRHFRWYAFVLAGYTAVLIGVPVVKDPNGLFLAALTRSAEVSIGILCSAVTSALVFPVSSSAVLLRSLRQRQIDLIALCADVLGRRCDNTTFDRRFAKLADGIAGFEAARTFASFENPNMRARSRRFARIDSEYTSVCTRLHMLHQLIKRLGAPGSAGPIETVLPIFAELAGLLDGLHALMRDGEASSDVIAQIVRFQASLPGRIDALRVAGARNAPQGPEPCIEQDTATQSLQKLLADLLSYLDTDRSLAVHSHELERSTTHYRSRTSAYVVALTFVRSALAVGAAGAFWFVTAWPSGGFAVIGAAVVAGLTSAAPRPDRLALQIAAGAACGIAVGYSYQCFVYPSIDGFPLLSAALAPVIALGAFLASRPKTSGYGVGLLVFFGLLAGPDNAVVYAPDLLLNNGVAVEAAILLSVAVAAVAFPLQAPWVVERIQRDLRREVSIACYDSYEGVAQRFHSRTHDLLSQLRMLLTPGTTRYANAWHWMLATLEFGHAVIDLRANLSEAGEGERLAADARWGKTIDVIKRRVADLFDHPDEEHVERARRSVERSIQRVRVELARVEASPQRARMERVASQLIILRNALLDPDAPFHG